VIVNIWRSIEYDLDAPILRMKIGHQNFDNHRPIHLADRRNDAREMICAAVFKIVARHRGDDNVFQSHPAHRFGHALRFVLFERERFRRRHRAKSAGTCAAIARDHHRRRALAPAFPTVRALRAFANGVQAEIGNERLGGKEHRIRGQTHLDPRRLVRLVQRRINFCAGHLKR